MFDLAVRRGHILSSPDLVDLGILDGQIAEVGRDLGPASTEIDAAGRWLLPGGVDSHVHLGQLSSRGDMTADDFESGSRAAAHGGTTTVVPFAAQHRGTSISEVVEDALARAGKEMTVDYGIHVIVTEFDERSRKELADVAAAGISAVKIYLTYDRLKVAGADALDVMAAARGSGLPVMIHAESDALVSWGHDRQVAAGDLRAASHAVSHSRTAEWAGVAEALALAEATGATAYLAHISTPEAVDLAQAARQRGVEVVVETCPHYLLLDEGRMDAPMPKAAPFMCSPPLRGEDDRVGLLRHLGGGAIDVVASDHSPYTTEQKLPKGADTPFDEVANGLPGIEVRLALLWKLVQSGHLTLPDFVKVTSTNPARVCGFATKGTLDVGADADLVVWDENPKTLTWEGLHDHVGYTPYEGEVVPAWPAVVVSRGEVVARNGADLTQPARGRFLNRAALQPERERRD